MTLDQKELIQTHITKDVKELLFTILDELSSYQEKQISSILLMDAEDERKIIYQKARAEGARKISTAFKNVIEGIKKS